MNTLRLGWRALWKAPRFTIVTVCTLALGIGLVTSVFSFLNGYLWRALPYEAAERIVTIGDLDSRSQFRRTGSMSLAAFDAVQAEARSYSIMAAYTTASANLTGVSGAERVDAVEATESLLPLLRVNALLGRAFTPEDVHPGSPPVVLLSHRKWQADFGADRSVIGQVLRVDGVDRTVIGVLPDGFEFEYAELWLPLRATEDEKAAQHVYVLGRLRDGIQVDEARAELQVLQPRLDAHDLLEGELRLHHEMVVRLPVPAGLHWLFLLATIFVLGIACANIVNLLFARGVARQSEHAIHAALGASRWQVMRATLAEALLLSLMATAAGLWIAHWTVKLLLATVPNWIGSWVQFGIDFRVLGFAAFLGLCATLFIGLAPAREAARVDLLSVLKLGGVLGRREPGVVRRSRRLVVLEIALSVGLCMCTLLLVRSFQRLTEFDPGYDADQVYTQTFNLDDRYASTEQRDLFYARISEALARTPGIEQVSTEAPFVRLQDEADTAWTYRPWLGVALDGNEFVVQMRNMEYSAVDPSYARTLGLTLLEGRFIDERDRAGSEPVVVLSRAAALALSPESSAVGRHLVLDSTRTRTARVIGVTSDAVSVRGGIKGLQAEPVRAIYFAAGQSVRAQPELLVRAVPGVDPNPMVQSQLRAFDPDQSITHSGTLAEESAGDRTGVSIFAAVFAVLAGCALVLALIGMYGVVSFTTEQRRAEIGLRMALGATASDIKRQVIGYGVGVSVLGVVLGVLLGFGLSQFVRIFLFGVTTLDPLSVVVIAIVFGSVAILSSYGPARRATRVDPLNSLRAQ